MVPLIYGYPKDNNGDIDDDIDDDDEIMKDSHGIDEEDEEGEVRLEIVTTTTETEAPSTSTATTTTTTTGITLKALLIGHEESVTVVTWHPHPLVLYGVDRVLLSSSIDCTILLLAESSYDTNTNDNNDGGGGGVWTPITRGVVPVGYWEVLSVPPYWVS
jgi:hypothetical protein